MVALEIKRPPTVANLIQQIIAAGNWNTIKQKLEQLSKFHATNITNNQRQQLYNRLRTLTNNQLENAKSLNVRIRNFRQTVNNEILKRETEREEFKRKIAIERLFRRPNVTFRRLLAKHQRGGVLNQTESERLVNAFLNNSIQKKIHTENEQRDGQIATASIRIKNGNEYPHITFYLPANKSIERIRTNQNRHTWIVNDGGGRVKTPHFSFPNRPNGTKKQPGITLTDNQKIRMFNKHANNLANSLLEKRIQLYSKNKQGPLSVVWSELNKQKLYNNQARKNIITQSDIAYTRPRENTKGLKGRGQRPLSQRGRARYTDLIQAAGALGPRLPAPRLPAPRARA